MGEILRRARHAARKQFASGYRHLRSWLWRVSARRAGTIYRQLIANDPAWAEARLRDTVDHYARLDQDTFKDILAGTIYGQLIANDPAWAEARLRDTVDHYARLDQDTFKDILVGTIYGQLIANDPAWAEARLRDTVDHYARLDRDTFKNFLQIFRPHEYLDYHRYRFSECFTAVTRLVDDTFGASEPFTFVEVSTAGNFFVDQMSRRYGERLSYVSVDFPKERGGTGSGTSGRRPGHVAVEVDLNQLEDFRPPESLLELVAGRNVIVLASEIIEHLLIDVANLVAFWRNLVGSGRGHMVVTTPNYHAKWRLAAMLRGINPLERYTGLSRVASGYVHIREYASREMLDLDPLVPGATCAFSFAMPGPVSPQLSDAAYFELADRFAAGPANDTDRRQLAEQMLGWEGLVAIYPFG